MKRYFFTLLIFSTLLVQTSSQVTLREDSPVSLQRIGSYMEEQVAIGPRIPGTEGSREFGKWLEAIVETNPYWNLSSRDFSYQGVTGRNYLITRTGDTFPTFLVGAHYDTRARATQEDPSVPVTGANDGASGVAGVIELMNLLSSYNCSGIGFVLFDAEDQGNDGRGYGMDGWDWIVGSTEFVESMTAEERGGLEGFVLLDMIANPDIKLRYEGFSDPEMREEIWSTAASLGYNETFIRSSGPYLTDDHRPFLEAGIPAVDIIDFAGYSQWHTTKDDLAHVSYESVAIVVDVLFTYLTERFNLSPLATSYTVSSVNYTPPRSTETRVLSPATPVVLAVLFHRKLKSYGRH